MQLPAAPKKFDKSSLKSYYEKFKLENNDFKFSYVSEETVLKYLQDVDPSKAAGIDGIPGRFLKDGADILVNPSLSYATFQLSFQHFQIIVK